jgi:hypothetical protein
MSQSGRLPLTTSPLRRRPFSAAELAAFPFAWRQDTYRYQVVQVAQNLLDFRWPGIFDAVSAGPAFAETVLRGRPLRLPGALGLLCSDGLGEAGFDELAAFKPLILERYPARGIFTFFGETPEQPEPYAETRWLKDLVPRGPLPDADPVSFALQAAATVSSGSEPGFPWPQNILGEVVGGCLGPQDFVAGEVCVVINYSVSVYEGMVDQAGLPDPAYPGLAPDYAFVADLNRLVAALPAYVRLRAVIVEQASRTLPGDMNDPTVLRGLVAQARAAGVDIYSAPEHADCLPLIDEFFGLG